MASANIEAARAAYEAYSRNDIEPANRLFASEAAIYGPVAQGNFETIEWTPRGGFTAFIAQIAEYWRIESYELIRLEAEGDWITAFIRMAAVNRKSDKRFEAVTINVLRFRDGLCVEFHEIADREKLRAAGA